MTALHAFSLGLLSLISLSVKIGLKSLKVTKKTFDKSLPVGILLPHDG